MVSVPWMITNPSKSRYRSAISRAMASQCRGPMLDESRSGEYSRMTYSGISGLEKSGMEAMTRPRYPASGA
ncbi:hypothetical protein DSECCO2_650560 [anaerobic digester metagenome]